MTLLRTKAVFILVELACLALVLSSIREIIQIVREED